MQPKAAVVRDPQGQFILPPLPYAADALAPVLSAEAMTLHHGKHHRAYVDKVNALLAKQGGNALLPAQGRKDESLEAIVRRTAGDHASEALFNNAAQAWNHAFFWNCLAPKGSQPYGEVAQRIDRDFGGYDAFARAFADAAAGRFGSGWAWLVEDGGRLGIVTTSNADTPIVRGQRCLLTLDVWEHAYYVDYRNERERYLKTVIAERFNWAFAEENLRAPSS